jgi:tetratricopeptide (TPR) repeat protein
MTIKKLNKFLELDPYAFNNTKRGWKRLPPKDQIIVLTAYILRYVKYNKWMPDTPKAIHEVTPIDVRRNLANCLALTGQNRDAIIQFEQCLTGNAKNDNQIQATIAFLNNDRKSFDNINADDPTSQKMSKNWTEPYAEVIK